MQPVIVLPADPLRVKIPGMKIRSITCFIDPSFPVHEPSVLRAGEMITAARQVFSSAGYEVQTTRLATVPFAHLIPADQLSQLPAYAARLEELALQQGFEHLSLGPALPGQLAGYSTIPEALAATHNTFFSGLMTTPQGKVSLPAVRACAEVIQRASGISMDGFANLRFAALANVPPGAPFFPAAYHFGNQPSFALATEAADLALSAFSLAGSLQEARQALVQGMETHARALSSAAEELERQTGVHFGGIDFSLAPFPDELVSLGAAMERLGVPGLGLHGSLAAAAILADTMDQASFARAGFSGLMLPVLEDATLARRAAEGSLGIKDLLLYSAVCGAGVDTVPLPGDTSAGQIAALLLDVAALSLRLAKPLTARLLPLPGKLAGDPTEFDFAYFANSRVLSIQAQPLSGFLAGDEEFPLHKRSN